MKKLALIAFCFASFQLYSQGNLQFNQVVNSVFTSTFTGESTVGSITVPAGKVLKIESASLTWSNNPASPGSPNRPVQPDGLSYIIVGTHVVWGGSSNFSYDDKLPIWLPSGTYDVKARPVSSTAYPNAVSISCIEFNIVP